MRFFIAIDVSGEVEDYLKGIQRLFVSDKTQLKLTQSYHLTLKFLGELNSPEQIIKKVSGIRFNEFELELENIGVFPNRDYVKVIWVGLKQNDSLIKLQKDITQKLSEFKKDKKFYPHITLARVKNILNKTDFVAALNAIRIRNLKFNVNKFILYRSTLTQAGPVYAKIREFGSC
ncbi:RNA 2',3'-cyclic phosphodiesterase [Candidatus Woesearchaeota archaeon]|nr:RNA 2',3'-cyclic phosphodiesterase [Candidatus Woesearchaeota archaeon]